MSGDNCSRAACYQFSRYQRAPNVEMPVPVCVYGMLSKQRLVLDLGLFFLAPWCKVLACHIGCYVGCCMGCSDTNKKTNYRIRK